MFSALKVEKVFFAPATKFQNILLSDYDFALRKWKKVFQNLLKTINENAAFDCLSNVRECFLSEQILVKQKPFKVRIDFKKLYIKQRSQGV